MLAADFMRGTVLRAQKVCEMIASRAIVICFGLLLFTYFWGPGLASVIVGFLSPEGFLHKSRGTSGSLGLLSKVGEGVNFFSGG